MRRAKKTWTAELGRSLRNDTLTPPTETWTSPDRRAGLQKAEHEGFTHLLSHINETPPLKVLSLYTNAFF